MPARRAPAGTAGASPRSGRYSLAGTALAVAHDAGVVHQDVKPQNVLLHDSGRALLADFGIALVEEGTRHTVSGSALGSLAFMPPEQRLDASSVDPRADLHAAGATLFHLVTARSPVDLFVVPADSPRLAGLPPLLHAVIVRATRPDPPDRFPDARRMAAALVAALPEAAPDVAPPPRDDAPAVAPPPANEPERLAALLAQALLDTEEEERFDRHTRLVQRLLDVPIALVSVVDRDRQWFKSRQGLDARETPRDQAFCAHAILTPGQLLVVPDARSDPRFRDTPLVTGGPGIRFYAGCPIRDPDGVPLGTLCVLDRRPRLLQASDLARLREVARSVEDELRAAGRQTFDPATGLSNRKGFAQAAQRVLGRNLERKAHATLVHLDLGPPTPEEGALGPLALREVGLCLLETWPEATVLARVHDREFCVLLDGSVEVAAQVDALRDALARAGLGTPSLRWAVAVFAPDRPDSPAVLMARAELGLPERRNTA